MNYNVLMQVAVQRWGLGCNDSNRVAAHVAHVNHRFYAASELDNASLELPDFSDALLKYFTGATS